MNTINFFQYGLRRAGTDDIINSKALQTYIKNSTGEEAYHCSFDLELDSLKVEVPTGDKAKPYKYEKATEELLKIYPRSVVQYEGVAHPALGYVWFDFDDKQNPDNARKDLLAMLSAINPPPDSCLIYFSGNAGFHLGVPFSLLGLVSSALLPKILNKAAVTMKETYKTLDTAVFNPQRKFRAPGSKNPKSGLYKIRLSEMQCGSQSMDEIYEMATSRGDLEIPEPGAYQVSEYMHKVCIKAEEELTPKSNEPGGFSFGMENVIPDMYEPNTIDEPLKQCAFLKYNFEHAAKATNPEWFNAIGVVSWLKDGREHCHTMSKPHAKYTAQEVDAEVDRAKGCDGPTSCEKIKTVTGFEGCKTCTVKVKSPAHIRSEEQKEEFKAKADEKRSEELESSIVSLGYDSGDYFFRSNVNLQIQRLSASSMVASGLCRLQPLNYWLRYAPKREDGTHGPIQWGKAANDLMQKCHSKGIFKPDNLRGRGVWRDKDRTVYHMGTQLWVDGKFYPLHAEEFKTKYIYQLDREMKPLASSPLTIEEGDKLIEISKHIPFKNKSSYKLFAGWLSIAGIGGSLQWRPHFWVSGNTGSGKSYVIEDIANKILSGYCQYIRGNTTEAGLRQKCGTSSLPVIFDEFESNDPKSAARVQSLLELLRQASSESAGIVARGTVSGEAMEFRPQWAAMVGSVVVNLSKAEDENRFTVTEILKTTDPVLRKAKFKVLEGLVDNLPSDYADKLFTRMLFKSKELEESVTVIRDEISSRFTARTAQQYSSLLAGYWMLEHDHVISEAHAAELVGSVDFNDAKESNDRKDEEDCFDHFMSSMHRIQIEADQRITTIEISMAEMLTADRYEEYKGPLERLGVVLEGKSLWVSVKNSSIDKVFVGTKWAGVYARSFRRLEACVEPRASRRMFKRTVKTVKLNTELLFK